MDILTYFTNGFAQALTPQNLLFAFLGAVLGTLVGVLPGIGPTSGIAILLPITSMVSPTAAIIMLAGIYYGAMYGGSTTAILVNTPGEVSSVATSLDGYQLARQGRAGAALGMAAISSFVAGTLGLIGLTFFAPPLANVALKFGPPEYLGLTVLALTVVINLAGASLVKGLISATLGFLFTLPGIDPIYGVPRFTFGMVDLYQGLDFISVVIGLFAIAEILTNSENALPVVCEKALGWLPTREDLRACAGTMLRCTGIGFFLGLLPGCSPGATSFIAYDLERRVSRNPGRFGKGAIEGVAAPEGANNATTSAGFIPLFSLGIPSSPALAVLLGGLMIYGLQPGPLLFQQQPDFVWTVIASMYIGNVILVILNLPLVGLWAKLASVPYPVITPAILVFSFLGAYTVRNSMFDVDMAIFFGVLGYLMRKIEIPAAPLVLSLILGPMLESSMRQTLSMSRGDLSIFYTRPITTVLLIAAAILTAASLYARFKKSKTAGEMFSAAEGK